MDRFKFRIWNGTFYTNVNLILSDLDADYPFKYEQSTGLQDKNDTLIYDGDIIKVYHFRDYTGCDHFMYKEVCWKEDTAQWYFKSQGEMHNQLYVLTKNTDCEVVGNIHENGDLLNG